MPLRDETQPHPGHVRGKRAATTAAEKSRFESRQGLSPAPTWFRQILAIAVSVPLAFHASERVQLGVLEESAVGVIGTYGDPRDEIDNGVVGADFQYFNSHFLDSDILRGNAFVMKSFSNEGGDDDFAFGASVEYPNDKYNGLLADTQIGDDFDPRLGFVNRRGIHAFDGGFRRRWRPEGYLRTVDVQLDASVVLDREQRLETAILWFAPVRLENQQGDSIRLQYVFNEERLLDEPFEVDPSNDVYLILRQLWDEEGGTLRSVRSVQAAKVVWTFRF